MQPSWSRASERLRFLVDENLPGDVAAWLSAGSHDVLDVATSPHRGSSDSVLWQLAIDEDRLLVTRDRDFPLQGVSGRPPGVVLLRPAVGTKTAEIVRLLEAALTSVGLATLAGHVTVVEPGRVRQRPYSSFP